MHRSRLTSVVIDCAEADFERGAEFWSAALGGRCWPATSASARCAVGSAAKDRPTSALQRVPSAERAIHLDIETDDVEAEVARLAELGARVKARIRNHVVMEAPSGHAFCVVPSRRGDFPAGAAEWP